MHYICLVPYNVDVRDKNMGENEGALKFENVLNCCKTKAIAYMK